MKHLLGRVEIDVCRGLAFTLGDQLRAEGVGLLKAYTQP